MLTQAAAGVTGDNNYGNTATNSGDGTQTVAFADVIGTDTHDRVHTDRVDAAGSVTLRVAGR